MHKVRIKLKVELEEIQFLSRKDRFGQENCLFNDIKAIHWQKKRAHQCRKCYTLSTADINNTLEYIYILKLIKTNNYASRII